VVQGFSTPMVFAAFVLAKRTHAPHLYFMYTIGNSLADLPGKVGISYIERLTLGSCLKKVSLTEINCDLAPHFRPREFMRPAQVDARGNFNNTVIGSYERPKVRLPGGAGIPDATNFNDHLNLYVPRHTTRRWSKRSISGQAWDTVIQRLTGPGYRSFNRGPISWLPSFVFLTLRMDGRGCGAFTQGWISKR